MFLQSECEIDGKASTLGPLLEIDNPISLVPRFLPTCVKYMLTLYCAALFDPGRLFVNGSMSAVNSFVLSSCGLTGLALGGQDTNTP